VVKNIVHYRDVRPGKGTYVSKEFAEKQNMFISNNTFSYQYLIIEGSSGLIIGLKSK